jgi:hypothetical protein
MAVTDRLVVLLTDSMDRWSPPTLAKTARMGHPGFGVMLNKPKTEKQNSGRKLKHFCSLAMDEAGR